MENVIAYIRVSTGDQNNSIEAQSDAIKSYCTYKNLNIAHLIIDEDVSGYKELFSRPGGKQLQEITNAAEIKTIISVKLDRLFRNVKDAINTLEDWNSQNINIQIIDQGGQTINTKTATGKMIFISIINFSEFERNVTSERTKTIINHKKANNQAHTGSIFGYDRINGIPDSQNPNRIHGGQLKPNPSEQETLSQIFNLHKQSFGQSRIASILNAQNIKTKSQKPWTQQSIAYILKNPFYQNIN